MKILAKLMLAAVLLATGLNAEARGGGGGGLFKGGSFRSSGFRSSHSASSRSTHSKYIYRNPYAAYPSVKVRGHRKTDGTIVPPHVRTPANNTLKDNLSYRGYGTIRELRSYSNDAVTTPAGW